MPSSDFASWGPQTAPPPGDQNLTRLEKAEGFGLDRPAPTGPDPSARRRTVRSYLRQLCERVSREAEFKGVEFTRTYPNKLLDGPRIVWRVSGRQAGVNGQNVNPFFAESFPFEDGTVIEKWNQMFSFTAEFQFFDTTVDGADDLLERFEEFFTLNPYFPIETGVKMFRLSHEGGEQESIVGGSQPVYKRTLYYDGVIYALWLNQLRQFGDAVVRNVSGGVQVSTVPLTRSSGDTLTDQFPVPGPVVLLFLHEQGDRFSLDYLWNVDYELLIDREQFGNRFYLRWIPRGRRPAPGAVYYASYLPSSYAGADSHGLDSAETDPGRPQSRVRRRAAARDPIAPTVLGQSVDPSDPARGRTVFFDDGQDGVAASTLSRDVLEALTRAPIQVATVLDPRQIPGLQPSPGTPT